MQRGLEGFTDKPHFAFLERHRGAAPIGADRRKTTGGIRPALKAAKQHWRTVKPHRDNAPFKKRSLFININKLSIREILWLKLFD